MQKCKSLCNLVNNYLGKVSTISLMLFPVLPVSADHPALKPNFILILNDDLGWTSSSQLMDNRIINSKSDYFETPNIERLAAHGVRFSNGYAPCALCCPTRRSIQFGQTPARQGDALFKENYHPDFKKVSSIPQMLKSITPDYRAAHYGKWDLRADIFPEDLGYDESDGNTGNRNGDMNSTKESKWTDLFLNNDPKRIETITERALNFMNRQTKSGHPFYLQVSHYATHVDFQTREETYKKYLGKKKGEIHSNPGFAGMLENLDSGIGQILDKIEELGIADHTYVIMISDNGGVEYIPPVKNKFDHPSTFKTHSNNYPLRGGKWTLYEGGIRVPFIVMGPGIKPGSQCDIPVTGWDFLPTFSDLAGNTKALPANLDGVSIRPLLEKGNEAKFSRNKDELVFHYFGKSHSAIRVGDYKLIKFWDLNKLELYNLKDDNSELNDLSQSFPEKVKQMETRLMDYLKEVHAEILNPPKGGVRNKKDKNTDD
jgi:arylsulfatase A-like enzyme